MDLSYALTPFATWLVAGGVKFIVNSFREGRAAFGQIGYGGMPSNHSAIVSSMAALIAIKQGIGNGMFGVAVTLAFIVILDARGLRRHVGSHAAALNQLTRERGDNRALRERVGHSIPEITAGVGVGVFCAWLMDAAGRWLPWP